MKTTFFLLLFIFSYNGYSQSLEVFDVDSKNFPAMHAKFYAFDENGDQITNLSPDDLQVLEDGVEKTVTNLSSHDPQKSIPISSVITIDLSESMEGENLEIAKEAARIWIEKMSFERSECAITSFHRMNYFNQDFTTSKQNLFNAIDELFPYSYTATIFDIGLNSQRAGALQTVEKGKNKKVVFLITDGGIGTNDSLIIQKAKEIEASFYVLSIDTPCPLVLRKISKETGGLWIDQIETIEDGKSASNLLLRLAQEEENYILEWNSEISCKTELRELKITNKKNGSIFKSNYEINENLIPRLSFDPIEIKFQSPHIGIYNDTTITVTAVVSDLDISNVISSNPAFSIEPNSFNLQKGESIDLTVRCKPVDSLYSFVKFDFQNDICPVHYYAASEFPGMPIKENTLKILNPSGGETYIAGDSINIEWEGVLPSDKVTILYSIDKGKNWNIATSEASNLKYRFEWIPKGEKDQILLKLMKNHYINDENTGPQIIWQRTFGGSNAEYARDFVRTEDGGLVVTGAVASSDGDFDSNKGNYDYAIVKFDKNGRIEWKNNFGGDNIDRPKALLKFGDSYIIAGDSFSDNGDVSENKGANDIWLIKVDSIGNLITNKTYGGRNVEMPYSMKQTTDGGFIIGGYAGSNNGDVAEYYGGSDMWFLKINQNFEIEWQRSFGGESDDLIKSMDITKDGSYIIAGTVSSEEGNVPKTRGLYDACVIKLDQDGNVLWQKTYGGSLWERFNDIKQMENGDLIAIGRTSSNDGDLSGETYHFDAWIVRTDSIGNLIWQKKLSGSEWDEGYSLDITKDGGYIVAIYSNSSDIDFSESYGDYDCFILKFDKDNNIEWKRNFGGSGEDQCYKIKEIATGEYLVAGLSSSNDHDVPGNKGNTDCWIFKVGIGYDSYETQMNESFTVIRPALISHDIQKFEGIRYQSRDIYVSDFLINTSDYPCRIDTIYIRGSYSDIFDIVTETSGMLINPKDTQAVEFRATIKSNTGNGRSAEIVIRSQYDTLIQTITAKEELSSLVPNNTIEFEETVIDKKVTSNEILVKNLSERKLRIDTIMLYGPNTEQFAISSTEYPLILNVNEEFKQDVIFKPNIEGRISGQIAVFLLGQYDSPALVPLYGEGVNDGVWVEWEQDMDSFSISPNPAEDKLDISLSLTESGYTELAIYNVMGEKVQTVLAENISEFSGRQLSADVSELSSGQYMLILKTPTHVESRKIIVMK